MNIKQLGRTFPEDWPHDAGETIIATLKNPSAPAAERILAVNLSLYESVMDDGMAGALLSILADRSESVELRKKAAESLALAMSSPDEPCDHECHACSPEFDCGGEEALSGRTIAEIRETMQSLYYDCDACKDIRRAALEASTSIPEDWHPEAVRMAYTCGDPEWVLTAVSCMSDVEGFDDEILESIDSADPQIRIAAVRAAGSVHLVEAWPRIQSIIVQRPDDRELLLAAIEAAPWTGGTDSDETLEALLDDEDPEIAEAADEALMELESEIDDDEFDDDFMDEGDFDEDEGEDEGEEESSG